MAESRLAGRRIQGSDPQSKVAASQYRRKRVEHEVRRHPILESNGGREGAFIGTVHRGGRWRSQCPGPRGSGLGGWQGLDKGEASRSWDNIAFLVVLKELFQSLHVQRVIVVNFLLGVVQALGHRDGAPH